MVNGRLLLLSLFVCAALALTGCGVAGGLVRDSVTVVQVDKANFKIAKKNLSASTGVGMLFCSIPIAGTEPYREVMEQLHKQGELGPNQAFVNLREDHKVVSYFGVWCSSVYTISGDVIEFSAG